MADEATPEQIAEYESQLDNIKELLEADPQDESLLELKNDIEELLQLTRANLPGIAPQVQPAFEDAPAETDAASDAVAAGAAAAAATPVDATKSKKKQKLKDFIVPPHLVANEADSEAEKNRKRRAAKALKNKWREKKKEIESVARQKSWQSFQKKGGNKRKEESSIFAT
jgi:hypothetical protein